MKSHEQLIPECEQWLEAHHPSWLEVENPLLVNKAGIVPIYIDADKNISCMLMKPKPKHADLPPPGWQITKGTRMKLMGKQWVDLPANLDDSGAARVESMATVALRETMEEIGLRLNNIRHMLDIGIHSFSSAKSGEPRQKALYACIVDDQFDFAPLEDCDPKTAAREWFNIDYLPEDIRADNASLIGHVVAEIRGI